jgi:hypothetical protein
VTNSAVVVDASARPVRRERRLGYLISKAMVDGCCGMEEGDVERKVVFVVRFFWRHRDTFIAHLP